VTLIKDLIDLARARVRKDSSGATSLSSRASGDSSPCAGVRHERLAKAATFPLRALPVVMVST
jgi:hypothetical protein